MLHLVTLPPAFGMRNVSPFCLKIEMLLTSLKLPFEMSAEKDPRKAPKGKLPYLIADGARIADSELITEYLDGVTGGRVYAGLTSAEKGQGVALARLAEDHLYWLGVASRWLDPDWFPNVVTGFFDFVPALVRPVVARLARRQVAQTVHLHGLARHTLEEQKGFATRDLEALAAVVPDDGFLFGDVPGIFDFTVAAMLAGFLDNQPATWLTELMQPFDGLRAYAERVQATVGVFGRS